MYTREIGRDFWFDFDNQTLWQRTPEVSATIASAYTSQGLTLDSLANAFVASWRSASHPSRFRDRVQGGARGIQALVDIQLGIVSTHLTEPDDVRMAFEDFGQGVLFDDRDPRPAGRHIHMMDGSPSNWVGFRRWLTLLRAAEVLGHAQVDALKHLKYCVLLAWAIQTEADPDQASPNNRACPPTGCNCCVADGCACRMSCRTGRSQVTGSARPHFRNSPTPAASKPYRRCSRRRLAMDNRTTTAPGDFGTPHCKIS